MFYCYRKPTSHISDNILIYDWSVIFMAFIIGRMLWLSEFHFFCRFSSAFILYLSVMLSGSVDIFMS